MKFRTSLSILNFHRKYISQQKQNLKGLLNSCSFQNFMRDAPMKPNAEMFRNIGIMAHIDAGKTTTTERMLFYGNFINNVGEVHDGNTVMDYMDQERERGITITSAAISFHWKDYQYNLIDTPGHVDFTMEVERSLRVIDGAIAVFDASAGVEAQSMTVWFQADRYDLPRICFLNKMDKPNCEFKMCLDDIENKLKTKTLPIQIPIGQGKSFSGIVDLVDMKILDWSQSNRNTYGKDFRTINLNKEIDEKLWSHCMRKREALVEDLADLDNSLAEIVLQEESTELISSSALNEALRRVTIKKLATPVLLGSAYKNIGVQPLMDGIKNLLPSPFDRIFPEIASHGSSLCASAFKITYHKRLGFLTFIRVYSGTISRAKKVYNANQKKYERVGKLFTPLADDFEEVIEASQGNIVVATGFKDTITGDRIVDSEDSLQKAELALKDNREDNQYGRSVFDVVIPEPVFICSIEAPSLSQQKNLDAALTCLQKEDPSLKVSVDEDSGQTILSGMGELHLSIIEERIRNEHKVDAELGPLIISYKEGLVEYKIQSTEIKKTFGDVSQEVFITLSLEPCEGYKLNKLEFAHSKENAENLQSIKRVNLEAVKRGILSSLMSGPKLRFAVVDVKPKLHWLKVGRKTADTFVAAAAFQCVQQILKNSQTTLMEPVMKVEIVVPDHKSSVILADLAKRRAQIDSIGHRHEYQIINAICPLSELIGFSSKIRIISSGLANISLEFNHYSTMTEDEQAAVISSFCGSSRIL